MLLIERRFSIKLYINNNIKKLKDQHKNFDSKFFLKDYNDFGKERPWKDKKIKSLELAESYNRLGIENKFLRSHQCGNCLEFKTFDDGSRNLSGANFCNLRLCIMCNWRREKKIFSQVSKVINHLNTDNKYRFLFLTLTCKNVSDDKLKYQLDLLSKSYKRLFERKEVEQTIKGWFRALEITHDVNKKITKQMYKDKKKYYDSIGLQVGSINPNFNMYHPHIHVILMVNKSYFSHKEYYITQKKWTSLWQESLRCDYIPIVNIKPFKANNNSSVSEVAKYTVKDNDYLVKDDFELTDKTVLTLDIALAYRRLVAFGKLMKNVHKKLNLSDIEKDNDLIHINDDEKLCEEVNYVIERYKWNIGYSNYIKL